MIYLCSMILQDLKGDQYGSLNKQFISTFTMNNYFVDEEQMSCLTQRRVCFSSDLFLVCVASIADVVDLWTELSCRLNSSQAVLHCS